MRRRPDLTPEQQQAADSFIEGANRQPSSTQQSGSNQETGSGEDARLEETQSRQQQRARFPWEEPRVREDVTKNYPLRLPEPLYLKLKFVSNQTGRSMNQICNEAVEASVEAEIERLQSESAR